MSSPRLFTNLSEISGIKKNMRQHDWYAESYLNLKKMADLMLKKGFDVPKKSGFVFFDTCSRDNGHLIFDPYKPNDHVCSVCGMNYKDEPFQRAWICHYHSWLSQMGTILGIVYLIDGDESYAKALKEMLLDYVKYYVDYPNNDNELGPTKVFQSTYMESVWATYLSGAYDMVRHSKCFTGDERTVIENDLFRISANVILDYDEKMNNRQAFNNAALCSIGLLVDDKKLVDYSLNGIHGFVTHMNESVLEDGLWYEGDNYHFATVPSIVNIAEVCRHNGINLYEKEFNGHTVKMLFEAPLMSLQPDLTFPSRKDSRYANHIAQRWYAGLYELAYSRYRESSFARMLKIIYSHNETDDFTPPSAAGIMDIFKPELSRRDRLDWRGFLNATPDLGSETGLPFINSINMSGTGLAVLRKNDSLTYASLDYGKYGGGHGHPDRLNLNYFTNGRRWLADWGTGNYYFDHLKWYRSTIGHNTIGVDGKAHLPADGVCTIFEETSAVSITAGKVSEIAPGVDMSRTILLLNDGLLFDFMSVDSKESHQYHYTLHSFGELVLGEEKLEPVKLNGENYNFIKDTFKYSTGDSFISKFDNKDASFIIHTIGEENTTLYKGKAYGPPDQIPTLFPVLIVERNGRAVDFASVMEDNEAGHEPRVQNFKKADENTFVIECKNGIKYEIKKTGEGWIILIYDRDKLSSLHSFGLQQVPGYAQFEIPLKHFECKLYDNICEINGPEIYGSIALTGINNGFALLDGNNILINGDKKNAERENKGYVIKQSGSRCALVKNDKLFAGIENRISIQLCNFTKEQWSEDVCMDLPAGWRIVEARQINLEPGAIMNMDIVVIPELDVDCISEQHGVHYIKFHPTGDIWSFEVVSPIDVDGWIPYDQGSCFKLCIKNKTESGLCVECSLISDPIYMKKHAEEEFIIPLDDLDADLSKELLTVSYSVKAGLFSENKIYSKALVKAIKAKREIPADSFQWKLNIHMMSESQVRRGEKHWKGPDDLSGEAMVCASEEGLIIKLKVKDDYVLFSGGKFFFDNDSIQLYIDRRPENYRKIPYITSGVYGLAVIPGVFDNSSSLKAVGTDIKDLDNIGLSVHMTSEGYEMLLDIPWECIGGKPNDGDLWGFDIIINDRDSGVRRDLQMLWSGCLKGERTYLMEQFHNPVRFGLLIF